MKNYKYECLFIEDKSFKITKKYNDGVHYRLNSTFTKKDLSEVVYLEELKIFNNQFYSDTDIDLIIDEKDIDTLQNINPLLFYQYINRGIYYEFEKFLANYITEEQFMFFPDIFLKKMRKNTKMIFKKRFGHINYTYKAHVIVDLQENKKIIAFQLNSKFKSYLNKIDSVININNNILTGEINKRDIENYLDTNIPFVEKNKEPFSIIKMIPKRRSYYTQTFLDMVENIYVPATVEGAKKPSNLVPENGIHKIETLLTDYNISKPVVLSAIAKGELGYYKITPRKIRVSTEDFDDYIERKLNSRTWKVNRQAVIEEKKDDYIDSRIIFKKFNISEETAKNPSLVFYKYFKDCRKYYNKEGILYYKKIEFSNCLKQYYGVFEDKEFKVKECPYEILYLEDFYTINEIKEIYNINTYIIRKLLDDGLPCINFNKDDTLMKYNQSLIRKDDINKILEHR